MKEEVYEYITPTYRATYIFWVNFPHVVFQSYREEEKVKRTWMVRKGWYALDKRHNTTEQPEIPDFIKAKAKQQIFDQLQVKTYEQYKK